MAAAPLVCGRPADYLPSGAVGRWPPATGQRWNERRGGDPKTDQVTQGADSELPGWQPKEKAARLPQKGGTLETAWVASVQKKEGPAAPLAAAGCCGVGFFVIFVSLPVKRTVELTACPVCSEGA